MIHAAARLASALASASGAAFGLWFEVVQDGGRHGLSYTGRVGAASTGVVGSWGWWARRQRGAVQHGSNAKDTGRCRPEKPIGSRLHGFRRSITGLVLAGCWLGAGWGSVVNAAVNACKDHSMGKACKAREAVTEPPCRHPQCWTFARVGTRETVKQSGGNCTAHETPLPPPAAYAGTTTWLSHGPRRVQITKSGSDRLAANRV
jgi:hypothetical protein